MSNALPPENSSEQSKPEHSPTNVGDKIDDLVAALTAINQANRDADDAREKTHDHHEDRMFKLERAGVIGLAIYCIFTALEWVTFNSERVTMEKEFKMAQTNAQREADAAERQLSEMQKENTLAERPWVFDTKLEIEPGVSSNTLAVKITVKNLGRTPALRVDGGATLYCARLHGAGVPLTLSQQLILFSNYVSSQDFTLLGNPMVTLAQDGTMFTSTPDLTNTWVPEIKIGVTTLFCVGTVLYEDVFGWKHETQFCYEIGSNLDGTITCLPFHNSIDTDIQSNKNNTNGLIPP